MKTPGEISLEVGTIIAAAAETIPLDVGTIAAAADAAIANMARRRAHTRQVCCERDV